jgi:hypothetical protein
MNLVAMIGKGNEGLGQVSALINRFDAEKMILIKDKSVESFPENEKCEVLEVNCDADLASLCTEMKTKLNVALNKDFEVALSIASGTGKDHMALISALLTIPVGVKIVAYTKNGIEFLS